MGLKGFINRISGGEKGGNVFCFVFGSDKRFVRRQMTTQGSHFQDDENRLAYFSSSEGVGTFRKKGDTGTKALGPVSIAYELTTELYSFPSLGWIPDRLATNGDTNGHHELFEDDEVLDNGWSEAFAVAHQKTNDEETKKRLTQILLLAVLGAFMMFLLIGASTGLLGNLLSGFGKVFGGG